MLIKGQDLLEKELKRLGHTHAQLFRDEWVENLLRRYGLALKNEAGIYDRIALYKSKKDAEPFVVLEKMSAENIEFNVYLSEDKLLSVSSSSIINSLQLVDLSGKTIKINLSGAESNSVRVSVESLSTGLYIVLAQTENGVKTSKIIIK